MVGGAREEHCGGDRGAWGQGKGEQSGGRCSGAALAVREAMQKGGSSWGLVVLTGMTKVLDSSISNIFHSKILSFSAAETER